MLNRLRLLFHVICIDASILLVSSLPSFLKHAVIWFVTKNGIQGMVEYNACLQRESAYHSMISLFQFKYAGKRGT